MKIGIELSPDRQKALLYIPAGSEMTFAAIKAQLADAGVVYGIDAAAVKEAVKAEERDRQIVVAKGRPVVHAKPGRLSPMPKSSDLPRHVEQDAVIGQYQAAARPSEGMGVNGLPVQPRHLEQLLDLDGGLVLDTDGSLRATRTGWFFINPAGNFCVDPEGCPMTADQVPITIANSKTRASVDIPAGYYVPLLVMREAVARVGVTHGIHALAIKQATKASTEARILQVASATPPQHGGDGRLDHLVEARPAFEPDEHGNLDFRDYNSIVQVKQGQVLASIGRATDGVDGMNVLGETIPAEKGKDVPIEKFIGEGTTINPDDGKEIIADRDGIYQRDKTGKLNVVQVIVVEGDVDHASGSIETDYAVIIQGDIKQGFKVKSGADIQVSGVVEDARVTAQGNLEVRGGILPGKHRVKAHGNISAAFVRERDIKCHDLVVHESLRHCQVLATGCIHAKIILGGDIKCTGNIVVEELGGRIEAETKVHVGVNPYIRSLVEEARKNQERLDVEQETMRERVKLVQAHLDRLAKRFMMKQSSELKKQIDNSGVECRQVIAQYHKVVAEREACEAAVEKLKQDMYQDWEQAKVHASRAVYAHVTVRIGPTYYNTVLEQLTQSTFQV